MEIGLLFPCAFYLRFFLDKWRRFCSICPSLENRAGPSSAYFAQMHHSGLLPKRALAFQKCTPAAYPIEGAPRVGLRMCSRLHTYWRSELRQDFLSPKKKGPMRAGWPTSRASKKVLWKENTYSFSGQLCNSNYQRSCTFSPNCSIFLKGKVENPIGHLTSSKGALLSFA